MENVVFNIVRELGSTYCLVYNYIHIYHSPAFDLRLILEKEVKFWQILQFTD